MHWATLVVVAPFDPAMVVLDQPSSFEVISRPVFNIAVWGDALEHPDETVAFQMHERTARSDGQF